MRARELNFQSKSASILLIGLITIPPSLIFTGIVYDIGTLWINKAQTTTIAETSASSGISYVGDLISDQTSSGEINIEAILSSKYPEEIAQNYININNLDSLIIESYEIEYPYNASQNFVSMQVLINSKFTPVFSQIFGISEVNISEVAVSTIQIQND